MYDPRQSFQAQQAAYSRAAGTASTRSQSSRSSARAGKQAADTMRSAGVSGIGGKPVTFPDRDDDRGSTYDYVPQTITTGLGGVRPTAPVEPEEKSIFTRAFDFFKSFGADEPEEVKIKSGNVYDGPMFGPYVPDTSNFGDDSREDLTPKFLKDMGLSIYRDLNPDQVPLMKPIDNPTLNMFGVRRGSTRGPAPLEQAPTMEQPAAPATAMSAAMAEGINKTLASILSPDPDVPYIVQTGDTLSEIANKTGTTVQDLVIENNIKDKNKIYTGEELKIPSNKSKKTKNDIVSSLIEGMGGLPKLGSSFEGDGVETASSGEIASDALSVEQTLPFITGTGTQQGIRERAAYEEAYKAGLRGTELQAYMAQIAHETGNYKYVIEGDYSLDRAKQLSKNWKDRLERDNVVSDMSEARTQSDAKEATPENILNSVYANRLGNGDFASGDGYKFRGRGYIQLSGRKNYKEVGDAIGIDLETNPELMEDPTIAAKASVAWWKMNVQGKVPKDDYSNTDAVSGLVNRGSPNKKAQGLADRKKKFNRYGQKITTPSTSLRPPIRPAGIMSSLRPPLRPENL